MPKISIIIPVYNGEKFLEETIQSVLVQTISDWELIIVNDGSKDNTEAIARKYAASDSRVRLINQSNAGVAMARNTGLNNISDSSDYVIFLDADDLWKKDTLEILSEALNSNPQAVAAHGLMEGINDKGQICEPGLLEQISYHRQGLIGNRPVDWSPEKPTTFAVMALLCVIPTPGQTLIRRKLLQTVGYFDSQVVPAEDWDLWLRLSIKGDIQFVNKIVLQWRQHTSNASNQKAKMERAQLRIYRQYATNPELTSAQRHMMRLGYHWSRLYYAQVCWKWTKDNLSTGQWLSAAKLLRHTLRYLMHGYLTIHTRFTAMQKI